MTSKKINEILDGCAFLECCGSLYEYIGNNGNKMVFQALTDDGFLKLTYDELRKDECYRIQY